MTALTTLRGANSSSVAYGGDRTTTNFAWALHAGVSYDISPQFTVDLAYRYANLGNAKSGQVTTYLAAVAYDGLAHQEHSANDVMLGFRYKLYQRRAGLRDQVTTRPGRAISCGRSSA